MTGKDKKNNLDQKVNFRLPINIVEFVDDLVRLGIYGSSRSEVFRNIMLNAMNEISEKELVRKTLESRKMASDHGVGEDEN